MTCPSKLGPQRSASAEMRSRRRGEKRIVLAIAPGAAALLLGAGITKMIPNWFVISSPGGGARYRGGRPVQRGDLDDHDARRPPKPGTPALLRARPPRRGVPRRGR